MKILKFGSKEDLAGLEETLEWLIDIMKEEKLSIERGPFGRRIRTI